MNNNQALTWGQRLLESNGITTARLDALVLLEDTTGINRARLLAEPLSQLTPSSLQKYKRQIEQRAGQLPLAYVRGRSEFYGREFKIDQRVLEPRPESESMIDELKTILTSPKTVTVIDVGTGSGALIITAKLELPFIDAVAIDIASGAITVARRNIKTHRVKVDLLQGDLIQPLPDTIWSHDCVILANLPYVPDYWQLNPPALREPAGAIFGGPDGLDLYRRLFAALTQLPTPPVWVLTESLPPQHQALKQLAKNSGFICKATNDFILVFGLVK
jgi:release factor glutamine methyltransferase